MARKYVLQRGLDHRVNWSSELEMSDRMADERNKKLLEHAASVRWVRSSDAAEERLATYDYANRGSCSMAAQTADYCQCNKPDPRALTRDDQGPLVCYCDKCWRVLDHNGESDD